MRLEDKGNEVVLRLSRRNLVVLLDKVERDGSVRTLTRPSPGGRTFTIIAERDEDHYGDRTPGPVHPATEEAIRGR